MPTRFPFFKTEKKLTVMVREEVLLDNLHSAVSSNLRTAKNTCHMANRWLQARQLGPKLLEVASKYFQTPSDRIDDADLATIRKVVTEVWTGLSGDVTIKTSEKVGKAKTWDKDKNRQETDDLGQVTPGAWDKEGVHYPLPFSKPYHNIHVLASDSKKYRFGAIKIAQDVLRDRVLGPVTIIHEATHKYAGTGDYWYYDDKGIDVADNSTLGNKTEALHNADSYAWFMWYVRHTKDFIQDDDGGFAYDPSQFEGDF
jgi:hypothetical protein